MKLQEQTLKKIRSVRVKAIELHSTKPLAIVGLYNGYLQTWNIFKCSLINETQVSEFPIRSLALVEKNNCVLLGCDDGRIYIYELNNLQRLNSFDAHLDFIRKIIVNPNNTEFLTCSDDSTIKLWEISSVMNCLAIFSGHNHFVMDICFYPKDAKQFISCSLDGTVKLWDKEQKTCIKTYKGHKSGINTLSFCKDDLYFITGSDDLTVKVWELHNGNCIRTLSGHTNNIINVYAMEKFPFIISCSEDGSYRLWDNNTFENNEIINLNSGRVWQFKEKNNMILIGTDEELIFKKIKIGTSLITLKNKKLIFNVQNFIYSCRLDDINNTKKLAELDFYPSELKVSNNGKFIAIVDEKSFYVYSSLGFRNKISGIGSNFNFLSNEDFLVSREEYIDFYKQNVHKNSLKIDGVKNLVVVKSLLFGQVKDALNAYNLYGKRIYSWNLKFEKVISVGKYIIIEKSNKILIYAINEEIITAYLEQDLEIDNLGIPDSFVFLTDFGLKINSYCTGNDLLIFENDMKGYYIILRDTPYLYNFGTLNGTIGGLEENNIYMLNNKKIDTVVLDKNFLNFQINVLDNKVAEIKESYRIKAISFYESLGMNDKALEICINDHQKFEILLKLGRLGKAFELSNTPLLFDRVGQEFLKLGDLANATECFYKSSNWKSLLFVDLLCNKKYLNDIAENAVLEGENNIALIAYLKQGRYDKCKELLKDTKFYNFFKKTYLD